jgi:hypothetical protein
MPIASAGSYTDQSPVPVSCATPQASPMAQVSAPVYGSPYGYPYSPAYSYGQPAYASDGQSYYQTAPYPPTYYYAGGPSYDPRAAATTDASGTANAHPGYAYYGYPAYPYYPPAPYWPSTNPDQTAAPPTYYAPAYSPPMEAGTGTENRSATPTPAGHASVTEAPVETQ